MFNYVGETNKILKSRDVMDNEFISDDRSEEGLLIAIYQLITDILSGDNPAFNQWIEGVKVTNLSRLTDAVIFQFAQNPAFLWNAVYLTVTEVARRYANAIAGQDVLWQSDEKSEQYGEPINDEFYEKYK